MKTYFFLVIIIYVLIITKMCKECVYHKYLLYQVYCEKIKVMFFLNQIYQFRSEYQGILDSFDDKKARTVLKPR